MDREKPVIRCLIAYPRAFGHVYLSRQDTITLEEAESYKAMGFHVLSDPADEQAVTDWYREQQWWARNRWL